MTSKPALRARDNPFKVSRLLTVRYRALDDEPKAELLARLASRFWALGGRAAIVGPEGHGKTTLLEDLVARRGPLDPTVDGGVVRWLALRRETPAARAHPELPITPFLRSFGARDLVVVDGLDLLAPLVRWRIERAARRTRGLLVASHRTLPSVPTLHVCTTSPALLAALVHEVAPSYLSLLSQTDPEEFETLFERHRGNLRDALRELFDRAAERASGRGAELSSAQTSK